MVISEKKKLKNWNNFPRLWLQLSCRNKENVPPEKEYPLIFRKYCCLEFQTFLTNYSQLSFCSTLKRPTIVKKKLLEIDTIKIESFSRVYIFFINWNSHIQLFLLKMLPHKLKVNLLSQLRLPFPVAATNL